MTETKNQWTPTDSNWKDKTIWITCPIQHLILCSERNKTKNCIGLLKSPFNIGVSDKNTKFCAIAVFVSNLNNLIIVFTKIEPIFKSSFLKQSIQNKVLQLMFAGVNLKGFVKVWINWRLWENTVLKTNRIMLFSANFSGTQLQKWRFKNWLNFGENYYVFYVQCREFRWFLDIKVSRYCEGYSFL